MVTILVLRAMLMWCFIINYVLMMIWGLMFMFGRSWMNRLLTKLVSLPAEKLDEIQFTGIVFYKLAIVVFNLVPWLALVIIEK